MNNIPVHSTISYSSIHDPGTRLGVLLKKDGDVWTIRDEQGHIRTGPVQCLRNVEVVTTSIHNKNTNATYVL